MSQKKGGKRQSGNPAARANPSSAPASSGSGTGNTLQQRSAPLILFLSQLPRWAFPLLMALLLIAGLMVPWGWVGGLLLLVLVAVLAWLTALSWPLLSLPGRLLRLITIGAAVAVAFARFTGRM